MEEYEEEVSWHRSETLCLQPADQYSTVELVELVELILMDSMQFSGSVWEIMQVWQSMSGMACR